jgi:predicted NBD/HSP70 family sugar kinase
MIPARQRSLLQALWRSGRLSRWELHEQTSIRPNTIGADATALLAAGIVREDFARSPSRGRPRVPLEIDPARRHVIGLGIRPGNAEICRLNLLGKLIDGPVNRSADNPDDLVIAARDLLQSWLGESTLGVGLSMPGFVDPTLHSILFSAVTLHSGSFSLQPIYEVAGNTPVVLENDMHAMAARWLLTHQAEQYEDVLLIWFEDGQLGAALLIDGRPNRGCVIGANELGHVRLPVETEICYCGQPGCLERICSTPFLGNGKPLADRAANYDGTDAAMNRMIELLAIGFSNALNFTRVNRLVLIGDLTRHERFTTTLIDATRKRTVQQLAERVKIELWNQSAARTAETAGWLSLASLYYEGWSQPDERRIANGSDIIRPT